MFKKPYQTDQELAIAIEFVQGTIELVRLVNVPRYQKKTSP